MFHYVQGTDPAGAVELTSLKAHEFRAAIEQRQSWLLLWAAQRFGGSEETVAIDSYNDIIDDKNRGELRLAIVIDGLAALYWLLAARGLGLAHLIIDPSLPGASWARALADFRPHLALAGTPEQVRDSQVRDYLPPELGGYLRWCYQAGVSAQSLTLPAFETEGLGTAPAAAGAPVETKRRTSWICGGRSGRAQRLTTDGRGSVFESLARESEQTDTRWLFANGLWHWPSLERLITALDAGVCCVVLDAFSGPASVAALRRFQITHALWADWTIPELAYCLETTIDETTEPDLDEHLTYMGFVGDAFCQKSLPKITACLKATQRFLFPIESGGWLVDMAASGQADDRINLVAEGAPLDAPYETGLVYVQPAPRDGRAIAHNNLATERGCYATGMLGYRDHRGALFVRGALADQIQWRGRVVLPAEVQLVLVGHRLVRDAWVGMVEPLTEATGGLFALVSLTDGVQPSPVLAVTLMDYCSDLLAASRRPEAVYFIDQLPRFRSGALNRQAVLRDGFGSVTRRLATQTG